MSPAEEGGREIHVRRPEMAAGKAGRAIAKMSRRAKRIGLGAGNGGASH